MILGKAEQRGTWTIAVVVGSVNTGTSPGRSGATSPNQLLQGQVLELAKRAEASHVLRHSDQVTSTTWFRSSVEAVSSVRDWLYRLETGRESEGIAFSAGIVTADCQLGDPGSAAAGKAKYLAGAASEGQAIVSVSTYEVARDVVPEPIGFKELGTIRVNQEIRRERAFQLTAPGLRETFPSLLLHDTVINNSPREFGFLVGRHEERDRVQAVLETHHHVTIVGPAGIGKSHLACRVAGEVLESWAEGIVWVDLVGMADAGEVRVALSQAFGLQGADSTVESEVIRLLRGRDLMVVFDGADRCHSVVSNLVREISRSSGPRMIITSTKRLDLPGEQVVPLQGLALPPREESLSAEELEDFEASALFMDRARSVRPNFDPESDVRCISEICHRLDGNPLAIVLAARKARSLKPMRILERLSTLVGSSASGKGTRPSKRHANLVNAIEWSCKALEPSARELLTVISFFRGSWRVEDAAALAERDDSLVSRDVQELLDAGLVLEMDNFSHTTTFRVQGTVGAYIRKALGQEAKDGLHERHSEYFLGLLCQTVESKGGAGQIATVQLLDWYRRDFEAAFEHTIRPGKHPGTFVEAMMLSWKFWYLRNRTKEALSLVKRAIRVCPDRNHIDIARLFNAAGVMAMRGGDSRSARSYFKQCLAVAKRQHHDNLVAVALGNYANLEWSEARPEQAIPLFDQAISILRQRGERANLGRNLLSVVGPLVETDQLGRAEEALAEAKTYLDRSEDGIDRWSVQVDLAVLSWAQGRLAEAERHLTRCAELAKDAGDFASLARSHLWMAQAKLDSGQFEQAAQLLGVMKACGNSSGTHLYPTNELRAARIEGAVRNKIGSEKLRENRLWGEITANFDTAIAM